jgi:hypothetical protein
MSLALGQQFAFDYILNTKLNLGLDLQSCARRIHRVHDVGVTQKSLKLYELRACARWHPNQSGAAEAWWAHNPQVEGSKPSSDSAESCKLPK